MSEKSEVIAKFSTNPEVMERVDKLWNLHGQDNSTVEALLQGIAGAGKEEDAIIVELDHEIDKIQQEKSPKMGGSKKRRNSNKNKKSRRNKKSNKRRRNRK